MAVLLVVLDHARIGPFHGGFIGVDVFFVISGFLITGLLIGEAQRQGRISLLGFYARRAKRIIPAATLVLVVDLVASYFLLSGVAAIRRAQGRDLGDVLRRQHQVRAATRPTTGRRTTATSPIQHYWSLAVEEQFYLVWPLIVLAPGLGSSAAAAGTAAPSSLTIAVISLASFAYGVYAGRRRPAGGATSRPRPGPGSSAWAPRRSPPRSCASAGCHGGLLAGASWARAWR